MNRVTSLFTLIPIYFLCICLILLITISRADVKDLEQLRLQKVIDRCTDASTSEMLEVADLDMDYADEGRLAIDPSQAVNTFVDIFLLNYGLPLGKENRELVKIQYLPIMLVATYDGYYIYETVKGGEFVATPKYPYTYVSDTGTYALNFSMNKCLRLREGILSKTDMPITTNEALTRINTQISEELMYRLDKNFVGGFNRTVYFPAELTKVTSANAIKGPTVLAFVDGVDINSSSPLSCFSLGGTEVESPSFIVGYKRDGVKYYSWAEVAPAGAVILDTFNTMQEAAEDGYTYDVSLMG